MSLDVHEILSHATNKLNGLTENEHSDKRLVNVILDKLVILDFRHALVTKNIVESFINAVCQIIRPIDGFTVAKACNVLSAIFGRGHVSLSSNCIKLLISWLTRCALESPELVLVDVLQLLQRVLYGNGLEVTESHEVLLGESGILFSLIESPLKPRTNNDPMVNAPEDITLLSLQCIQAITYLLDNCESENLFSTDIVKRCSDLCLKILYREKKKHQDERIYCKVIICCLAIMSNLFTHHSDADKRLSETLGACRAFMVYHLLPNRNLSLQKLTPSQQTIAELPNNVHSKGGKRPKVRKQRASTSKGDSSPSTNCLLNEIISCDSTNAYQPINFGNDAGSSNTYNVYNWRLTSDSEMSDSENAHERKLKALQAKLRHSALTLLSVLIRLTDRRDFFGYWWAFLPSSPDPDDWMEGGSTSLTFCAVKEPTSSGKAMALSVISSLVSGSRLYLFQAEISKRTVTSFTPFSVTLGCIISSLHRMLCMILETVIAVPVLIQALKCISALVQATPYHRLGPNLVKDTVGSVRSFLTHKDCTVQVAALICMGCIMSIDPPVETILESITWDAVSSNINKNETSCDVQEDFVSDEETEEMLSNVKLEELAPVQENAVILNNWLVEVCFSNLGWKLNDGNLTISSLSPLPVILESLQVLSAISQHHFSALLLNQLVILSDILSSVFNENQHAEVALHVAKCIRAVGDAILKTDQRKEVILPINNVLRFWNPLISGPLTNLLQSQENPSAKAFVCDCIASIGEKTFDRLKTNVQTLIITLLVGSCSDEEALVRAASVRALAICVMYSSLRQDIYFVTDCGESILRMMSDSTPSVIVKASWALGNLSDALVINMTDPEADTIDNNLLIRLFDAAINASKGNEKLKMNAMRSLGNLLRLRSSEQIGKYIILKTKVIESIQRLVDVASNVSNVKIKWNACYAIGSAMKNDVLYSDLTDLLTSTLDCLTNLVVESRNLKVRINAAVALRSPTKREMYGNQYNSVWTSVINALENSNDISDFTEYKHKDNLMEQLCVTLAHLTCLLSPADLVLIEDALCFHGTSAALIAARVKRRVLPQTKSADKLLDAAKFVTSELNPKSESQKQCVSILQDIFVWEMN